jgi:hypothetical protein
MSSSTLPLWGQAWELTVTYASGAGKTSQVVLGSSAWEPEALRVTFEVVQNNLGSPFWFADIDVYNLSDTEMKNAILNAEWVELKAGFQDGSNFYSTIWSGPIYQVLIDRERVVDQRITLHCVANPGMLADLVAFAVGPFSTQNDIVARMVSAANLPPIAPAQGTQSQTAFNLLDAVKYPRGRGVFGKINKYLSVMASGSNLTSWYDGKSMYMSDVLNPDLTPQLFYAPAPAYQGETQVSVPDNVTASIIGTPQQSLYGVDFSVLLDPRLKVQLPVQVVELNRDTFFRQIPLTPPVGQPPSPELTDLRFLVAAVSHVGDTRGNVWETRVTGYTPTYAAFLLRGMFAPGSTGGSTE